MNRYYVLYPNAKQIKYENKVKKQKTCKLCLRHGWACKRHRVANAMHKIEYKRITDPEIINYLNQKLN